MEYITVRDAAQKWNISERLVQKYCAMGRIEGAKKFGASWVIPAGAVKPKDPRKAHKDPAVRRERRRSVSYPGLMPLMNTAFEPGKCLEFIQDMADGPQKQIALAEYYYFSGRPEMAKQKAEEAARRQAEEAKQSGNHASEATVAPAPVKIRKTKNVSIKMMTGTASWRLESKEDIDRYMGSLRKSLEAQLDEDTIVNVEF